MKLTDLHQKTCLIGLSYFNQAAETIKQSQLAGTVVSSDPQDGITIELFKAAGAEPSKTEQAAMFILPPTLSCWFKAPKGHYSVSHTQVQDPDYLVSWDIHQTQEHSEEGQHEWWQWVPRTAPPQVGKK